MSQIDTILHTGKRSAVDTAQEQVELNVGSHQDGRTARPQPGLNTVYLAVSCTDSPSLEPH